MQLYIELFSLKQNLIKFTLQKGNHPKQAKKKIKLNCINGYNTLCISQIVS